MYVIYPIKRCARKGLHTHTHTCTYSYITMSTSKLGYTYIRAYLLRAMGSTSHRDSSLMIMSPFFIIF